MQVRLSLTCARWNGSAVLVRWRALLDPLAENDPDLLAAKSVFRPRASLWIRLRP